LDLPLSRQIETVDHEITFPQNTNISAKP